MVYGVARRADMYMVLPGGHDSIVYGVVWRAWHGICYGPVEHGLVFVLALRSVAWHM